MKSGNSNTLRNFVQEKKRKSSLDHLVKLSLQNDSVWYCPFITTTRNCPIKTTMCDTVVSQRQRGILSLQSDNVRYCPVQQKHAILFVQNDNMWYCPVKTTTCDTIPSKRQLVILSLQNENLWYCPFKTKSSDNDFLTPFTATTCDTVPSKPTMCDTFPSHLKCHSNLRIVQELYCT